MNNIQNEKSCINFIWCINPERWGTLEKIIDGKNLEIQDIIPNFMGDRLQIINEFLIHNQSPEVQSFADYYFAQNIASWAINYPDNPVRLIYHPTYINYPMSWYEWQNKTSANENTTNKNDVSKLIEHLKSTSQDILSSEIRNFYEHKLQDKYHTNLTLDEIEKQYEQSFKNFEKEMHAHGYKNFNIVSFKDLVLQNLDSQTIETNHYMQEVLNNEIMGILNDIDYIRLAINHFGFGYEKNLTIDMDMSPQSMNNNGDIEFNGLEIMFGNPRDPMQLLFTSHSQSPITNFLINKIEDKNPYHISCLIEPNKPCNFKESIGIILNIVGRSLPEGYNLKNIVRYGNSHMFSCEDNLEPIHFEANYWPSDNTLLYFS